MKQKINFDQEYQKVHLIENNRGMPIKTESIVAYCHNLTHTGYITKSILKKHDCVAKNCPFLDKSINPEYWEVRTASDAGQEAVRQKRKELRKQRKERLKKLYEGVVE